jgi:hypothetical protein
MERENGLIDNKERKSGHQSSAQESSGLMHIDDHANNFKVFQPNTVRCRGKGIVITHRALHSVASLNLLELYGT